MKKTQLLDLRIKKVHSLMNLFNGKSEKVVTASSVSFFFTFNIVISKLY